MARILAILGFRLLLGCAAAWGFWYLLGAFGLVMSAPLFGALLAKPILDLIAELFYSAKDSVYADVKGCYFEHRGVRFNVLEDERHHRWVSVKDVRKVMPQLPRDGVLRRQFPEGLRHDRAVKGSVIRADALLAYLVKSNEPDSVKFRNWLAREVVRPAATIRGRLGVHDPVPSGAKPPAQAP
jgi:hypothetical protein